mgnify:CR=1 FL=1
MSLRTGDILLFNEHPRKCLFSFIDGCIRWMTNSPYSHAGMVIVDPEWAPKGTYVWDSSWHVHPDPQDNKIKFGIALVKLEDYLENVDGKQQLYKRSPVDPKVYERFTPEKLRQLHDKVYGKHYDLDIGHWFAGFVHSLIPRSTKTFFCSAFVSFALTEMGVLAPDTDWTVVSPAMLSSTCSRLTWECPYQPDEEYP